MTTEAGRDGRLALQYWFFYPYNDYTNKHEGDWEMVQLVFAADDAAEALDQTPIAVGYSQHEGLEVAEWDDPKLEIVDGTHPVVHAAAGSHANFYDDALYLGTSAEQGFGCDDTRDPADDVRPGRRRRPRATRRPRGPSSRGSGSRGAGASARRRSTTGRPGRTPRTSWTHPISYQEQNGRDLSYAVPAGGLFGTSATDFFCAAVSSGSEVVRKLADNPARLLVSWPLLGAARGLAAPPHHLDARSLRCASPGAGPPGR